jgi:selenide,water dikinase
LGDILETLPAPDDANLLVGYGNADDGAVYRLANGTCLVQTVDFFTPIVDDPEDFGAISAANALSDIYAMGGAPLTALSLVCYPYKTWPAEILAKILQGATAKVREAGAVIVGGHSVGDEEIKFGLAVTGTVEQDAFWTNQGAKPEDVLVLTKPLGTGTLTTAVKRNLLPPCVLDEPVREMKRLNARAAELAREFEVHAVTDITGFGLMGHLFEMVRADGLGAVVRTEDLPLFPEVWEAAGAGALTGAHRANREYVADYDIPETCAHDTQFPIIYDPQTSGGLLIACPTADGESLTKKLIEEGHQAAVIGKITKSGSIVVK